MKPGRVFAQPLPCPIAEIFPLRLFPSIPGGGARLRPYGSFMSLCMVNELAVFVSWGSVRMQVGLYKTEWR